MCCTYPTPLFLWGCSHITFLFILTYQKKKKNHVLVYSFCSIFICFCFYVYQQLVNMQRLAGSEEVSPIPDVSRVIDSSLTKEIENSIESSLLKVRFFLEHFLWLISHCGSPLYSICSYLNQLTSSMAVKRKKHGLIYLTGKEKL